MCLKWLVPTRLQQEFIADIISETLVSNMSIASIENDLLACKGFFFYYSLPRTCKSVTLERVFQVAFSNKTKKFNVKIHVPVICFITMQP